MRLGIDSTGLPRFPRRNLLIRMLPLLVLAISLSTTFITWDMVKGSIRQKAFSVYKRRTSDVISHIVNRMQNHELVLLGGKGLFTLGIDVDRRKWRSYVSSLQLDQNLPGILGVGYAQWLTREQKEPHLRKIRSEGFPEYNILPAGDRPAYSSIVYLEPFTWRNQRAFGYDMYSEPTRRAALDRARDTGVTTVSGKITLVQETERNRQSGILMCVPVYRPGMPTDTVLHRREALQGFVYSPFRMNDFVYGAVDKAPIGIAFEIFDGDTTQLARMMFSSLPNDASLPGGYQPDFAHTTTVEVYGRTWTISFLSLPEFARELDQGRSTGVLIGGLIVSVLLTLITLILRNTREKALALAGSMTTELQLSEKRYREQFQELSQIYANTPAGIFAIDRELRFLRINEYLASFAGKSIEEHIGRTIAEILPADFADYLMNLWRFVIEQGACVDNLEFEALLPNDASVRRSFLASFYPLRTDGGGVAGLMGSVLDITERKQLEARLHLTNVAMDSMSDAVHWVRPDATIYDVNCAACRMLGYSREEFLRLSLKDIDGYFTYDGQLRPGWDKLKELGETRFETTHCTKDGRDVPVEISANYITFNGTEYACAIVRDISERKQSELLRERLMLRQWDILDNLPMQAWLTGVDGRFEIVNDAFADACGRPVHEIVGRQPCEVLPPSLAECHEAEMQAIRSSRARTVVERVMSDENGVRWYRFCATPLFDELGAVVGATGIVQDVTGYKRTEEILEQARVELERQVRERTLSLLTTNYQLQQEVEDRKRVENDLREYQKKLETMALELSLAEERERCRIAGELHDQVSQRLILSKIKISTLASQLSDNCHEQAFEELLQLVDQSIHDIRTLTFQMRPPVLANAGLEAAVAWLAEEIQEQYGIVVDYVNLGADDQKPVHFEYEIRSTIYQVVRELLLNVVKHAGTQSARICLERQADSLTITVADDGAGFDTSGPVVKSLNSGGYGLFNARQKIEYMRGELKLESVPGKGTQATIMVPMAIV